MRKASQSEPDARVRNGADGVIDDDAEKSTGGTVIHGLRIGLIFVLVTIIAVVGLGGWLGYQAYSTMQEQRQDAQFLEAGKQAAVKLTSISYAVADGDVKRILESATGPFAEDFQARSQPFVDMIKRVQSTTAGTVAEAGLESIDGDKARILVAVSVKTTLGTGGEQPTRLWRMRIEVQKIGNETKVSNVEFVP